MNRPSLEYLKSEINKIDKTKQAIIFMAETDTLIKEKIKQVEENAMNQIENTKPEIVYFDPTEIERIVLRRNNEDKGMER